MRPIDEHLIEQYVRFRDTLDEEMQRAIEAHLQNDEAARATAAFYATYYDELLDTEGLEPDTPLPFLAAPPPAPEEPPRAAPPAPPEAEPPAEPPSAPENTFSPDVHPRA